ncbi:MAG: mannonate dehydratase [Pseudomonadota bacterium]
MEQTWRWFGPGDPVSLAEIRQAGATGIVTALHHMPPGTVWPADQIAARLAEIASARLSWQVVESLPVSEDIKQQSGAWRSHLEAYRQSLTHLARAGIEVICYNFMPVLDWTRTDLAYPVPSGATCMRFDLTDFAAFDLHILQRPGAEADFDIAQRRAAKRRFDEMDSDERKRLAGNITRGLPGGQAGLSLADLRDQVARYAEIDARRLRDNHIAFLEAIVPTAESLGLRLCCHPDDPPFPLLGLPRTMSTEADYAALLDAVDSPANGITLCSGSLGARPDNDLPGMMRRLGDRVHFLHLRNVRRETGDIVTSFFEDEHLGGHTDMVALVQAVLAQEAARRAAGRSDHSIPFRPDHGQDILDDQRRETQPGYPAIGRLKGLAELRGVIAALSATA